MGVDLLLARRPRLPRAELVVGGPEGRLIVDASILRLRLRHGRGHGWYGRRGCTLNLDRWDADAVQRVPILAGAVPIRAGAAGAIFHALPFPARGVDVLAGAVPDPAGVIRNLAGAIPNPADVVQAFVGMVAVRVGSIRTSLDTLQRPLTRSRHHVDTNQDPAGPSPDPVREVRIFARTVGYFVLVVANHVHAPGDHVHVVPDRVRSGGDHVRKYPFEST